MKKIYISKPHFKSGRLEKTVDNFIKDKNYPFEYIDKSFLKHAKPMTAPHADILDLTPADDPKKGQWGVQNMAKVVVIGFAIAREAVHVVGLKMTWLWALTHPVTVYKIVKNVVDAVTEGVEIADEVVAEAKDFKVLYETGDLFNAIGESINIFKHEVKKNK
jgi:hypothetical protein